MYVGVYIRIHGFRIEYSGFRKRAINQSLMTRQFILSSRGFQKIHNSIGTPPCTFRQPWYDVAGYLSALALCYVLPCILLLRFDAFAEHLRFKQAHPKCVILLKFRTKLKTNFLLLGFIFPDFLKPYILNH